MTNIDEVSERLAKVEGLLLQCPHCAAALRSQRDSERRDRLAAIRGIEDHAERAGQFRELPLIDRRDLLAIDWRDALAFVSGFEPADVELALDSMGPGSRRDHVEIHFRVVEPRIRVNTISNWPPSRMPGCAIGERRNEHGEWITDDVAPRLEAAGLGHLVNRDAAGRLLFIGTWIDRDSPANLLALAVDALDLRGSRASRARPARHRLDRRTRRGGQRAGAARTLGGIGDRRDERWPGLATAEVCNRGIPHAPSDSRAQEALVTRDWFTAIHEAGHALIATCDRVEVTSATIVPSPGYLGLVIHKPTRNRISEIRISVAGPVAERLAGASWKMVIAGARTDAEHARVRARARAAVPQTNHVPMIAPGSSWTIDEVIAQARVTHARTTLDGWVTEAKPALDLEPIVLAVEGELVLHWDALTAIARALVERGTIDGERVRDLVAANPPADRARRDAEQSWEPLIKVLCA